MPGDGRQLNGDVARRPDDDTQHQRIDAEERRQDDRRQDDGGVIDVGGHGGWREDTQRVETRGHDRADPEQHG